MTQTEGSVAPPPAIPAVARTGGLTHASRWSVFQREATWRLSGAMLERAGGEPADAGWFPRAMRIFLRVLLPWYVIPIEAGGAAYFPCADIVRLRLRFDPTRFDHERHRCEITMRDGVKVSIWSTHYVSVGEFENRAATYTPFVRALIARIAAANPACDFRVGKKGLVYWSEFAFLLAMFTLLVFVLMAFGGYGVSGLVIVKLIIIIGFIPLLLRYMHKNRPGRFRPDAIPDDALPATE
jgi:hypothetical protein